MFCDICDRITCASKVTFRVTSKGKEIIIEHCEDCKNRVERYSYKYGTFRIKNKITKKVIKKKKHHERTFKYRTT